MAAVLLLLLTRSDACTGLGPCCLPLLLLLEFLAVLHLLVGEKNVSNICISITVECQLMWMEKFFPMFFGHRNFSQCCLAAAQNSTSIEVENSF